MNMAKTGETAEQIRELVIETAKKMAEEDLRLTKKWERTVLYYLMTMTP